MDRTLPRALTLAGPGKSSHVTLAAQRESEGRFAGTERYPSAMESVDGRGFGAAVSHGAGNVQDHARVFLLEYNLPIEASYWGAGR
jgi:hypothetical protein